MTTGRKIIERVLRKLTVLGEGEDMRPQHEVDGLENLNMMLKSWSKKNVIITLNVEFGIFFSNRQAYTIGENSTDRIGLNPVVTRLTKPAASAASSLTVDNTEGITIGDNIGIVLDDNTIDWTTVVTIPDATTLTITTPLSSTTSASNHVYTYTRSPGKLHDITSLRVLPENTPINITSRSNYLALTDTSGSGTPHECYIDIQNEYVKIFLNTIPTDRDTYIKGSAKRRILTLNDLNDEIDLTDESETAIVYNLAVFMAPEYDKEEKVGLPEHSNSIASMAAASFNLLMNSESEHEDYQFMPMNSYPYGG